MTGRSSSKLPPTFNSSRARAAPRDRRIPISFCRAIARASIMLATLALASSSTRPNATASGLPMIRSSDVKGIAVAFERSRILSALWSEGSCDVICRDHARSAAFAEETLCR